MKKVANEKENKPMKPTNKLRWVELCVNRDTYEKRNVESDTCVAVSLRRGRDDMYFVLQQYWQDGKGNGEWREIEIDWQAIFE